MDFNIEKVVDSAIEMSKIIKTDYKTIWDNYTHELITSQFTWEEIEKDWMKEIHAYQNDDGTYRVVITDKTTYPEIETKIEKADIHLTVYTTKNDQKLCAFIMEE